MFGRVRPGPPFPFRNAPMAVSDAARRIGRLVWPDIRASRGEAALQALEPLIERFGVGGVILFGEGMPGNEALLARLRLMAGPDLLVSSDLERGCGQQVSERSSLPTAMAIAAGGDPSGAFQAGLQTGAEARAAGIDVVYAPVADVNTAATNPIIATRAFGDDPHVVAAYVSAFAAGVREGGALAVGKHYPGHGCTVQDSHNELARVTHDAEAMEAIDLVPFRTLIAEGVDGLMVGHLEVPALDPVPGRPATISPNVVLDHLRHRLGFNGLVVTDALDMGGFPQEPIAGLDVLQSGHDILLMPADPLATAEALLAAHERGHLPDEVLDGAVARVDAALTTVRGRTPATVTPELLTLGETLRAASLTARGPAWTPPTAGQPVDVTLFGDDSSGMVRPAFIEALAAHGHASPEGPESVRDAFRVGLVITSVAAWLGSSRLPDADRRRMDWALQNGRLDLVVVLGSPYEALDLPDDQSVLIAYEHTPITAQAAVTALVGAAPASGRLPVGPGPVGAGS